MADEKDRLGEKLREKEKAEEDRYFKQRDQEAIERLRRSRSSGTQAALDCPKDGSPLTAVDHHGVLVDECPTCRGMWLDAGELETLAAREKDSWLGRFFYRPRL